MKKIKIKECEIPENGIPDFMENLKKNTFCMRWAIWWFWCVN
jgi:hypothetical protein